MVCCTCLAGITRTTGVVGGCIALSTVGCLAFTAGRKGAPTDAKERKSPQETPKVQENLEKAEDVTDSARILYEAIEKLAANTPKVDMAPVAGAVAEIKDQLSKIPAAVDTRSIESAVRVIEEKMTELFRIKKPLVIKSVLAEKGIRYHKRSVSLIK